MKPERLRARNWNFISVYSHFTPSHKLQLENFNFYSLWGIKKIFFYFSSFFFFLHINQLVTVLLTMLLTADRVK